MTAINEAFKWSFGDYLGVFILSLLPLVIIPALILLVRIMKRLQVACFGSAGPGHALFERKYRRRLKVFMATSSFGAYWTIAQVLLSILACIVYAIELYFPAQVPDWMIAFEII